jgi:hypothetical protein
VNGRAYRDDYVWDDDESAPEGRALYPLCPVCPSDRPYRVIQNTGRLGGLLCEECGTCFTGEPGESQHPKNKRRRELWAEEIRGRKEAS